MVCTVGHKMMTKERLALGRELWAAGIRAEVLFDPTEVSRKIFVNSAIFLQPNTNDNKTNFTLTFVSHLGETEHKKLILKNE